MSGFWTSLAAQVADVLRNSGGVERSAAVTLVAALAFTLYRRWRRVSRSGWRKVSEQDFVLVTGASSGIGRATALYLADDVGLTVFAGVRKSADGDSLRGSARHPDRVRPLILDVTKADQISSALKTVKATLGSRGLLALFNNAGITSGFCDVEHMPLEVYRQIFEVNVFGLIAVTQAFLPLVRAAKGTIVQNLSYAGFIAAPLFSPYPASKHAIEGFSDTLRREMKLMGARVVILEPGWIKSDMPAKLEACNEEEIAKRAPSEYPGPESMRFTIEMGLKVAQDPIVVAKVVEEAIRSPAPLPRYMPGGGTEGLSLIRILPEWVMDGLIMYQWINWGHAAPKKITKTD